MLFLNCILLNFQAVGTPDMLTPHLYYVADPVILPHSILNGGANFTAVTGNVVAMHFQLFTPKHPYFGINQICPETCFNVGVAYSRKTTSFCN